ncbi:hypothetical protein D9V86_10840 [Bacteroidetes/Chlorobi group bacterium ChocPot_Mid]|nr:MAG: hypothetical protein D9V86_10840 [Bacteroidetes/Chlorobi group bacterium ChocPot_Mid]
MKKTVEQEIQDIIKSLNLDITVDEFRDKADWSSISVYQYLSEDFMKEFRDELDWSRIAKYQKLSEDFMKEFRDELDWTDVASYQELSEDFMREFRDELDLEYVARYQKISEDFIRQFKDEDELDWYYISRFIKLSPRFIEEFKDRLDIKAQLESNYDTRTIFEKRAEMRDYANKWNLIFEDDTLYAFRHHDVKGSGLFNKTIRYEKGKYYRDWHCDICADNTYPSAGYEIYPVGNTPIKVQLNDWGVALKDDKEGRARVWGFEII